VQTLPLNVCRNVLYWPCEPKYCLPQRIFQRHMDVWFRILDWHHGTSQSVKQATGRIWPFKAQAFLLHMRIQDKTVLVGDSTVQHELCVTYSLPLMVNKSATSDAFIEMLRQQCVDQFTDFCFHSIEVMIFANPFKVRVDDVFSTCNWSRHSKLFHPSFHVFR